MRQSCNQASESRHSNLLEIVVALNVQLEPREFPGYQLNSKTSEQWAHVTPGGFRAFMPAESKELRPMWRRRDEPRLSRPLEFHHRRPLAHCKGASLRLTSGKGLRIKIVANPFLQFLMLVVVRIADGVQQVVVTRDATAVPGWTMAFSAHANQIRQSRFRRQHSLSDYACECLP